MRIRTKINISFISAAVVVLAILGLIIGLYTVKLMRSNVVSYLHSSNRARAEHVRTFIQDQKNTGGILAAASVYLDFLNTPAGSDQYKSVRNKIDTRFARTLATDPNLLDVNIIDLKGIIVASSNPNEEGGSEAEDDYFIEGLKAPYIKEAYLYNNELTYAVSAPIIDNAGKVLGVSLLRYKPTKFYFITGSEGGLGSTEENFLVNKDKYFITPSFFLGADVILKTKLNTQNVNDCFDPAEMAYVMKNGYGGITEQFNNQIVEAKDYRNIDVIATHAYIPEIGGCLITKIDTSDAFLFRRDLTIFNSIVLIICLLFVMFFSNYISRIITKSIDLLKFKAEKIKKGDFSDSENVKTKDELKDLDDTINLMTIELRGEKAKIDKKVNEQTQELNKEKEGLDTQRKAILNILEDVDAQRNKAEELARIVDGANESIISKTLDGTVLTWNKGAENLYGFTDNEIVGKSIKMIVPEGKEEEVDAIMKSVAVGQMRDHYQTVRRRKDGSLIEVSLTASPIKNVTGKVVAISVISIDITKERAIDKAKTEFVSLASHQLRTPLSAINWYTEMLMAGDVGKVNKEQMEYLNEVYTGSQRMVELVNALLNVSRLELGTFTISLEPVNVPALVKSLIKEMKSEIDKRKEVVTELYSPNLPTLSADNSSLRMVLQNLLSNSVKYTAAGGNITVEAAVKSKGEIVDGQKINEDRFILRVADSGMGIPKGQQNKVFEKLFRADNARTLETEGTGLGLYVIKSIVDQSGGEIWFVSEENKGTTFIISYPLTGMKKVEKK